jgi:hypothetical protein
MQTETLTQIKQQIVLLDEDSKKALAEELESKKESVSLYVLAEIRGFRHLSIKKEKKNEWNSASNC